MKKLLLTMLCPLLSGCMQARPVPDGPITAMEYCVDNATRYPTCHFVLRMDEDGRYWLTNGTGCDIENAPSVEVPVDFVEQLKQIVIEERMMGYKAEYSSWRHRHVCGGDMWRFTLSFADSETAVSSFGYMVYPKGNGLSRLEQLCRTTWEKMKG